jgi:Tetratricopeptide repeat
MPLTMSDRRTASTTKAPLPNRRAPAARGRRIAAARPDAFRPALATSLNNLSVRLVGLGRREEALAAIQEAVTIRRELATRWPDAYQHDLEQSLQVAVWLNHGEDLSEHPREEPKA